MNLKYRYKIKSFFLLSFLFFFSINYSQNYKVDSLRGNFTYLLKSKPNILYPNYVHEEFFLLQISDERSFFLSEKLLKRDSVFDNEFQKAYNKDSNVIDFRGKYIPKTNSRFIIIQKNDNIQYFARVGMTVLSYTDQKISNWKLVNETKIINSLACSRAEINFKGREWIAWYSIQIPFPYGPYKFGNLPGLIVKIYDKKGEYDFELVKSTPTHSMKGKIISINKNRYENSKLVSKKELIEANDNFRQNMISSMESMGTKIINEEDKRKLLEKQKKNEIDKKGYNPIELEN